MPLPLMRLRRLAASRSWGSDVASAVVTITAGGAGGSQLRRLAQVIAQAASAVPDVNSSGASLTLTINDAPGGNGVASVLLAGGGLATQTTYVV